MGPVSWIPLVTALLAAVVVVGALMGVTTGIALRISKWSVFDTLWGLVFAVIAVTSYILSAGHGDDARRMIALLVPVVWGVRLAAYLHLRNRGKPEDGRYVALLRRTGALLPHALRTIVWPQAWVAWVVGLPITVAMFEQAPVNALTWCGVALAVVGLVFETVGDAQLARFRADPANAGKIMDRGLWSWTRHPNYFGDICVMFSLWLIACGSWIGVLTIFAPLLWARTLTVQTGQRMLDRRMARTRGDAYADYAARTNALIPWPPGRRNNRS